MPETGQTNLEAMERLSPAQSGGDQDELLQAAGRAGDGQDVRASGGGTAHSCGAAQPLQPAGPSCDGGRGVNASGVWGMASQIWFMQQRPSKPFPLPSGNIAWRRWSMKIWLQ